ncbi:urease accessory protein UreD [uncultured Litoreibacter sp.]|uniref:urease accessory protein UreD n=1 Tax=uncultured Litoreibacter sp. TaxID=1392394 RepID=UPI002634613C|nr:urease accessory protein UreD [uncultured Litoreibacter sp.]
MCADVAGKTRLSGLRQTGSTKLVFPHQMRDEAEVILVNTAGGITGGDRYDLDISVEEGAGLTLTTQAAERAYRAQSGEVAQVENRLVVRSGARMNWLPQELILFDCCALQRRLDISLEDGATLVMVEPIVFGRAAMSEQLHNVNFQDRIKITRNSRPLYIDGMTLSGDAAAHLSHPAVANGAGAMASVVLVAPDAAAHLDALRAMLPDTAGASMLHEDVLVIRQLAADSYELRRSLVPALERLTQNNLPTSWRL